MTDEHNDILCIDDDNNNDEDNFQLCKEINFIMKKIKT